MTKYIVPPDKYNVASDSICCDTDTSVDLFDILNLDRNDEASKILKEDIIKFCKLNMKSSSLKKIKIIEVNVDTCANDYCDSSDLIPANHSPVNDDTSDIDDIIDSYEPSSMVQGCDIV